ncbi:glycosyltransferase family 4 protein [Actinophytocola sp.]|uniref:glycosyltransferase family 4 protein n=1 Tax=Actinophytocola sp. TaxID=1872138 RepID=UPI002D809456|nr:glycosyltransferase family 4 protein [Actinophytocola sp.]HET9142523.1 glycosyltransferase family 4 protein [Actinophytocola sp.]
MTPTIVVAVHDGWYGAGTGAGRTNRGFLRLVFEAIAEGIRLVVLPVRLVPGSGEHDPVWHRESLALVRESVVVRPIDNGTGGMTRFGGVAAFRRLSANTAAMLCSDILPGAGPVHLMMFDVPFFGVMPLLPPGVAAHATVVPRSTALLHDPGNIERVVWERLGLQATVERGGRIAATSPFMRRHLCHDYGIADEAIVDLPNGLTPEELSAPEAGEAHPLPDAARDGFLLAMGRAHPYKGFDDLLEAIRLLRDFEPPHLLLAAVTEDRTPDAYQRRLAKRIADERLNATLLPVFHTGIRNWLTHAAMKGVIVPSRAEPFGRVPTEAFAAGAAPVIATTAGGLADQVIEGCTGYTAQPADPADLAAALARALRADPATIAEMRAAGRRFVRERMDYARTVRRFLATTMPWAVSPAGGSPP